MVRLGILAACLLAACGANAPGGTLGLPSPRSSSPTTRPAPTPTLAASPSPSPTRSATGSPSATASASATPAASASPSAAPSVSPAATADLRPSIVSASATQGALTVQFDRPMRTTLACGTTFGATDRASPGSIDNTAHYRSTDPVLDEAIRSAALATINGDCASVTFRFAASAASGTFTIAVTSVQDRSGTAVTMGTSARVTIADEGRPQALRAEASGGELVITFSEPMLEIGEGSGVVMAGNYRLDGNAAPIVAITCADAGCRVVRIALQSGALATGRTYQLRIANLVDRAGRNITPDPTTLTFVAG